MQRIMLKSKIHRAKVTNTSIEYEGSITIDEELLEAVNIIPFEQVQVYNISNGARFTTYVIKGGHSGGICVNGAAARLADIGHHIIIASYANINETDIPAFKPKVVIVNEQNKIIKTK